MKKRPKDSKYEGRDKAYMDIDRMVSEGMAGGTVSMKFDSSQIEETVEFEEETRPNHADKNDE